MRTASLRMVTAAMKLKDASSLEKKAMTNLDGLLQGRNTTLPTIIKAMVFPVVMYGCESWTIKKAEHWSLCFWTVMLEKTLDSFLDSKEIKIVSPKEINLEYSLEGLMLKLERQCFGHLMRRADSFEKTLILGKIECRRRRGGQRMRWWMASTTQWTWVCSLARCSPRGHKESDTT